MKRWKTAVPVGAGVFTVNFLMFALPTLFRAQDKKALEQSAVETEGTIVRVIPRNHNTCKYAFDADGKSYTGGGTSCGDATVGDRIGIWYARDNPENSANDEPGSWRFPYIWLFWGLVVMPAFMVLGVLHSRKTGSRGQLPEN